MRQQSLVRVSDILVPPEIGIIGVGNIGSHAALTLARIGAPVLHLYDMDRVELHNVASQAYTDQDLGHFKVEAVRNEIKRINSDTIVYLNGTASSRKPIWARHEYLIVAVDTMAKRKQIGRKLQTYGTEYPRNTQKVIDVRVGGEQIDMFVTSKAGYLRTIRENPDTEPCGAQFVGYVSAIAGALAAKETVSAIQRIELEGDSPLGIKSYAIDVRNMQIVNDI